MSRSNHSYNIQKSISFAFVVLFCLVALVFLYKAATTSTDPRSRAGEGETVVADWEFNGSTTEGWQGTNTVGLSVSDGSLHFSKDQNTNPSLLFSNLSKVLPTGNKFFRIQLSVRNSEGRSTTGTVCKQDAKICPDGTAVSRIAPNCEFDLCPDRSPIPKENHIIIPELLNSDNTGESIEGSVPSGMGWVQGTQDNAEKSGRACTLDAKICPDGTSVGRIGSDCEFAPCSGTAQSEFVIQLYYRVKGKATYEAPLMLRGNEVSAKSEYSIRIPEIGPITIDSLRLDFIKGLSINEEVTVDWIRLVGPKIVSPTTAVCTKESYVCPDGSSVRRVPPTCEFASCLRDETPKPTAGVACTQEAKICPDGTSVSRIPPRCDFAPCQSPKITPQAGCAQDTYNCPDGTIVRRVMPACSFASCPTINPVPSGTPCTLEAKVCPNGTTVGRIAPSCNFAPCPSGQPAPIHTTSLFRTLVCRMFSTWCTE